jgi:serine/threonine-protein kinase RsbW
MGALERKFLLHVPSSTENLALIREFVTMIGAQAGLDESEVANIELAVDEACANVIEHAYGNDVSHEVVVRAIFDDAELSINVEDSGRGFNADTVVQEELDELISKRKSGGLGMRLIRQLMDEVHYYIVPGRNNELKIKKRLRKS